VCDRAEFGLNLFLYSSSLDIFPATLHQDEEEQRKKWQLRTVLNIGRAEK